MAGKTPAQRQVFESQALRYMQAYLPDAGFEYAVTHRYRTARLRRAQAEGADTETSGHPAPAAPGRTDLCVLALREFQPNESITYCTAALKDLSAAEDEALREEAANARATDGRDGRVLPQRDFSIIRSSSRKCSQLLLGPARFINHDCHPNAEFRRSGHRLSIRCIRPIKRNEEITTYYGDNYFEWGNKECMCATCERQHRGYFSRTTAAPRDAETGSERTLRSHTAQSVREQVSIPPQDLIAYQMDLEATGPLCECLTCHAPFRAPEKWWTPDECSRCERHYKLYKCDWPCRRPKENPAEQATSVRSSKRRGLAAPAVAPKRRKATEPDTESFAQTSPVKLSPVREVPETWRDTSQAPTRVAPRRRRFEVRSDDSDDGWDESALRPKILGHGASTDVLASYWGAPEGARRQRRPTHHGITVLSERRPQGGDAVAPRDASREKSRRVPKKRAPVPPREDAYRRRAESRSDSSSLSDESQDHAASTPQDSTPVPQIATKGPERTSVSNLALFWSGGVQGRTRQQARQNRGATPSSGGTLHSAQHGPNGRAAWSAATKSSSSLSSRAATTRSPPTEESKVDVARAVSQPRSPAPASVAPAAPVAPVAPRVIKTEPPSLRSLTPEARMLEPSPCVSRPAPLPTTALPPGVPPRQPLRRNLRWGSGKTSSSRPPSVPAPPVRTAWSPLMPTQRPAAEPAAVAPRTHSP